MIARAQILRPAPSLSPKAFGGIMTVDGNISGAGTLTLGGTTDNDNLAAVVNGGTLALDKTSNPSVHALDNNGIVVTINNGGTVALVGTGGDQIYDNGDVVIPHSWRLPV